MSNLPSRSFKPGKISYGIGWLYLKLSGWKLVGEMPDVPRSMLIVAHHTSNWDFPTGLALSFVMRIKAYWLGKHTLFKKPFGGFMRWLGGVPVDRQVAGSVVDQIVQLFNSKEEFIFVIAPEGTRRKVEHWKDGFYRIAAQAKVPITCGYLDYKRKTGGIGKIVMPTGNIKEDMQKIAEFYATVVGKIPEQQGEVRLKER